MSSSERTTAARMAADPIALEADPQRGCPLRRARPRGWRSGAHALPEPSSGQLPPAGARRGGVRTVPLRSVQPAPMARPAPGAVPARQAAPQPVRTTGLLRTAIQRAALWGAGPQGEHLAWAPARPARRAVAPRPSRSPRSPPRRHAASGPTAAPGAPDRPLGRRPGRRVPRLGRPCAPGGQARASTAPWCCARCPAPPRSSPRRLPPLRRCLPAIRRSTGSRGMPPVPRGAVAVPGVRPRGRPERSQATGWPPHAPASGGNRPDPGTRRPVSCPARGSPAPARRTRSPGSVWSSFP